MQQVQVQENEPHGRALLDQTKKDQRKRTQVQQEQCHAQKEGGCEGFCKRRMVTAEDPFSHNYGGSSEFDITAFSRTFDRK
jgi:hypothetical protein